MTVMTRRSAVLVSGGLAAVAGGALWTVKSLSILLTGDQPPLVFELAPPLFGLVVVALAVDRRHGSRASWALALGCVAVVAGSAAVLSDLAGELWGPAIALATIAVLVGLILLGMVSGRRPIGSVEWVALAIGVMTVPALLVGGALSLIDERLLEVPLLLLAGMWIWLGGLMLRHHNAS
jgi:hypothetical protein